MSEDKLKELKAAWRFNHEWHVALNKHNAVSDFQNFQHWMYEAKTLSQEVLRLARLFKMEREGGLGKVHKQCSMSPEIPIEDNYLTCCLGIRCAKCPELQALDAINPLESTPEQIDMAKSWTCCTHIVGNGGDISGEGYVLTVDDRMFWDSAYDGMREPEGDR